MLILAYFNKNSLTPSVYLFIGLALVGKDIVFRFIIEYSSLRDLGPYEVGLFSYEGF